MQHLTFHVKLKNIDNIVPVSSNIKFICRHDITEILSGVKHHKPTLKFICTTGRNSKDSESLASFSVLFRS